MSNLPMDGNAGIQALQARWCQLARAFDAWDHAAVQCGLSQLAALAEVTAAPGAVNEPASTEPLAVWPAQQHAAAVLGALTRAQLAIRDDAHGLALAELAAAASGDQRCTLLNALAQAQAASGQLQAAADTVAEGLAIARALGLLPREDELCELGANVAQAMNLPEREVWLLRRQRRLRHDMHIAEARRRARLSTAVLATERARREAAEAHDSELRLALDNQALQHQTELLTEAARRDTLTGLANRRSFDVLLAAAHARVGASRHALCLAYVDVDHFKRVNDLQGHAAGDAVLRRLAGLLSDGVRPGDLVARLGGEEFAVIFVRASWAQALEACERLRAAVAHFDWQPLVKDVPVTVSLGLVDAALFATPATACAEADRRLYAAKHAGRNRVHAGPASAMHHSSQAPA